MVAPKGAANISISACHTLASISAANRRCSSCEMRFEIRRHNLIYKWESMSALAPSPVDSFHRPRHLRSEIWDLIELPACTVGRPCWPSTSARWQMCDTLLFDGSRLDQLELHQPSSARILSSATSFSPFQVGLSIPRFCGRKRCSGECKASTRCLSECKQMQNRLVIVFNSA